MARFARLSKRSTLAVEGPDAEKFLQGLITNDMARLGAERAIHAALLSPQGKILHEFFVLAAGGGFILETGRARVADLVKRLSLYRLRAAVEISDRTADQDVYAAWGEEAAEGAETMAYPDPRLAALGRRFVQASSSPWSGAGGEEAYHEHRIALGVPDADEDYVLGDTFPHEACFDILGGVAFDKGCFIGQEVVSRMEHRGPARKRFLIVTSTATLPAPRTEIMAGPAMIGAMGSSSGGRGLALVRLDRASEAIKAGVAVKAGDVEVSLEVPAWAPYTLSSMGQN